MSEVKGDRFELFSWAVAILLAAALFVI